MSKCFSCRQDLTKARKKYTWYLAQGFDPKDASVEILRDPESKIPPHQCCITSLQTNVELEDQYEYEKKIKDRIAKKENGGTQFSLPPRELYTLFPVTSTGLGEFIVRDPTMEDLDFLASKSQDGKKIGFEITNISRIPEAFLSRERWSNANAPMLWFGTIKVICLERRLNAGSENKFDAGMIKWRNNQTGEEQMLSPNDVKFLNARVLEYSPQPYTITAPNGQVYQGQVEALIIEKVRDSENYYL